MGEYYANLVDHLDKSICEKRRDLLKKPSILTKTMLDPTEVLFLCKSQQAEVEFASTPTSFPCFNTTRLPCAPVI